MREKTKRGLERKGEEEGKGTNRCFTVLQIRRSHPHHSLSKSPSLILVLLCFLRGHSRMMSDKILGLLNPLFLSLSRLCNLSVLSSCYHLFFSQPPFTLGANVICECPLLPLPARLPAKACLSALCPHAHVRD